MNRFNNKKYYKPPPVKISNRLKERPKEEWNSNKSDLNKYKLSNAEIIKKKINATSKNLEEAKKDWQGQLAMIQNGKKIYYDDEYEGKTKIVRKKIDLTPMNRFEKKPINIDEIRNNERNSYQYNNGLNNNKINRPYSGNANGGNIKNKFRKNNSFCKNRIKIDNNNYYEEEKKAHNNNTQGNNDNHFYDDDDDGEIKMVGNNANVIETKINNEINFINNDMSNNAAFNELEKTIQKMQQHLQNNNEIKNNNESQNLNNEKNINIIPYKNNPNTKKSNRKKGNNIPIEKKNNEKKQ